MMSKGRARTASLVLVLAFGACAGTSTSEPDEVELEVIEDVTFDPSLGIDLSVMERLPSGVYILDRVVGTGASLAYGNVADLSYRGWLRTGGQFGQGTVSFLMGNSEVIPGLEQGMLGMKVGGTRLMIIPPILAWGERGAQSVPPGAIVIFEVELLNVS
jgi:hypothetical protein